MGDRADLVLVAASMAGVEALAPGLSAAWPAGLPLLSCTKGINLEQRCTPGQLWLRHNPDLPLLVLSGPEGGLSPAEESLALSSGFVPVTLGSRVLRAETAPLAVLAALTV